MGSRSPILTVRTRPLGSVHAVNNNELTAGGEPLNGTANTNEQHMQKSIQQPPNPLCIIIIIIICFKLQMGFTRWQWYDSKHSTQIHTHNKGHTTRNKYNYKQTK
jgi:hypothetical protein